MDQFAIFAMAAVISVVLAHLVSGVLLYPFWRKKEPIQQSIFKDKVVTRATIGFMLWIIACHYLMAGLMENVYDEFNSVNQLCFTKEISESECSTRVNDVKAARDLELAKRSFVGLGGWRSGEENAKFRMLYIWLPGIVRRP